MSSEVIEGEFKELEVRTANYSELPSEHPELDKRSGRLAKKTEEAFKLAQNHGLDMKDAYKLVNNGKSCSDTNLSILRSKYREWSLKNEPMVKLAYKTVQETLKGKEVNGIKPSATNRLTAAAMVYDRIEPVVKQQEQVIHHVFHPVDLSKFKSNG